MKHIGVIAFVLLGTCTSATAQSDGVAKQLTALENRFNDALVQADWKEIQQLEADDLVFTTANGLVTHKSDDVDSLRSGNTKFESIHEFDLKIQSFGDVGVVTGMLIETGRYKNADIGGAYRFTDVWAKRNGRWQLITGQETLTSSPDKAPSDSSDAYQQMIEFSRPSKNHKLLAQLVGTWSFTGQQLPQLAEADSKKIGGTLVRKSLYEGRFFLVETTSTDNIQIPVAEGMKEARYSGLDIEGYDNVRRRFITASIGNHLGSDISFAEGTYDPATKTITYELSQELVPGTKETVRERMKIIDPDHYTIDWYDVREGREYKFTEISATRQTIN